MFDCACAAAGAAAASKRACFLFLSKKKAAAAPIIASVAMTPITIPAIAPPLIPDELDDEDTGALAPLLGPLPAAAGGGHVAPTG